MGKVLLHVGCANRYYDGFVNSDMRTHWKEKQHRLDLVMNMGQPWPYEDDSVDGIIGMHVFQQLTWRELLVAFAECYRVLKPGGVLRMGVPSVEIQEKSLEWLLGWNNINLFSYDLLENVLKRYGFSSVRRCNYQETAVPEFIPIDNRHNRGTIYVEAIK